MPNYKLTYFNLRARGELIRWIFEAAGEKYEDNRVEFAQWPAMKATTPYGNLPILSVDGKVLAQSLTISRLLARRFKLAGANDWEEAQADEIVEYVRDAATGYGAIIAATMAGNNELADKTKNEYTKTGVVPFVHGLEKKLSENNNGEGYYVGSKPTWADFAVVLFLDEVRLLESNLLGNNLLLKAHSDRVHQLKGIKEWIARRPNSAF